MYNHKLAKTDKQNPSYEMKIILNDAENEIRKLFYLQQNYNPSPIEIERRVKQCVKHLENKYGSIANVRLYSQDDTLQKLIADNVYELFGKKYKP
jgi:hypothetical protein